MQVYEFKASAVCSEININEIAKHFGINKKYKWEEPMILDEKFLKGIIRHPENKYAYIFHFGCIIAINLTQHETTDILNYIKNADNNPKSNFLIGYIEEFKLMVDENLNLEELEDATFELKFDSVVIKELGKFHMSILSTILAKSVGLKKIETDIDTLLDQLENIIDFLDEGHLKLSDENLSKISGKVLRFKYSTLSNIMLLEKPDVAWKNEEAGQFFTGLSNLFELTDRYDRLRHKTEVLMDITEVFTGLTHAKRGNKLEWMVIVLILIELVLTIADKIFK